MSVRTQLPIFPDPPGDYQRSYVADLVRSLNRLVRVISNPGAGRNTTLVLTALPTNDYDLEPGSLFQVDGAVRISLLNKPYVQGLSANGRVGTVAVNV